MDKQTRSIAVWLIHGTFATEAKWATVGSPFAIRVLQEMPSNVTLHSFRWTGANNQRERRVAAAKLAGSVRDTSADTHIFIGHSHGGNVAMYAAELLPESKRLLGIVCFGTPFIHCHPRDLRLVHLLLKTLIWSICLVIALLLLGATAISGGLVGAAFGIVCGLLWRRIRWSRQVNPVAGIAGWLWKRLHAHQQRVLEFYKPVFPFTLPDSPAAKTFVNVDQSDIMKRYIRPDGSYVQWNIGASANGGLSEEPRRFRGSFGSAPEKRPFVR